MIYFPEMRRSRRTIKSKKEDHFSRLTRKPPKDFTLVKKKTVKDIFNFYLISSVFLRESCDEEFEPFCNGIYEKQTFTPNI